jgi:hypothetical protein
MSVNHAQYVYPKTVLPAPSFELKRDVVSNQPKADEVPNPQMPVPSQPIPVPSKPVQVTHVWPDIYFGD